MKSFPILSVKVNPINLPSTLELIKSNMLNQGYICCVPAHSIMECVDHPELLPVFNNAFLCTPDGMAVVWILKLLGFKEVGRVYGPDLMLALCDLSQSTGYRHFFFGGQDKILEDLENNLTNRYPNLQIVGKYAPPFRQLTNDEENEIKKMIEDCQTDILWVGLGSPKQEKWMYDHQGKINIPLMIGVGAAFDFLSGHKSQAPKWIQKSGLEWFYRFTQEPRRLFRRYILGYPRFIFLVLIEFLKKGTKRNDKPQA